MATSVENAASKAVGNTALGLSIGALGVELLNGGLQRVMGNLFGGNCNNQYNNGCNNCANYGSMGAGYQRYEIDDLRHELFGGALSLTKGIYDTRLTDINEKFQMREKDVAEKFSLYKYSTDAMAGLQNEISGLKTKMAVMEAIQPFKDQLIANAINQEAERRACADGKIVCYSNATFMPLSVVGATPDTTNVTQRTIFNPLCNCCA